MSVWSHLPNAAHIDRILADLRARPQAWADAWDGTRSAAWGGARGAALDAARGAARHAVWGAAYDAAWSAARDAAWEAARSAAWSAALALIAWDDAADVLAMPLPAVRLFVAAGDPRAILLLPAVIALEDRP